MRPRRIKRIDPNTLVLIKQVAIGVATVGGAILLVVAIWHGTRLQMFTIASVEVEGGETINHERVREIVERELQGEFIGFVPRRFTYLYPKRTIHDSVAQIERVHSVVVAREGRTHLTVTFDEYVPYALWCRALDTDECFFLDERGYAFGMAPRLRGGSFVRYVHLTEEPEVGRFIASESDFAIVGRLIAGFAEHGWYFSHVELDQVGDAFFHVVGGGELKVVLSAPVEETVENLLVILTSERFQHIRPGNFAYIDLRFGSKVFVNEELALPEQETATSTEVTTEPVAEEDAE